MLYQHIVLLIPGLLVLLHVKSPCFHDSTPISSQISNYHHTIDTVETCFWRFYKNFNVPRPTNFVVVTPSSPRSKISTKNWPKTSSKVSALSVGLGVGGVTIASGSRARPSHSWTSRLLTSSLFCRTTQCMGGA